MMTDEVIALLNDSFVPVSPGWSASLDREGSQYEWWKVVNSGKNVNGVSIGDATILGTTFWGATAAGRRIPVKGRCLRPSPGNPVLAANLRILLQAYARLPESERRPAEPIKDADRPKAAPPPGGLTLISYDRPLLRDGTGRYRSLTDPKSRALNRRNHIAWQPGAQMDAFWLTREECLSLMPKNPQKGQTFTVSPRLTKRIGFFGLTVRSAWQELYRWRPGSLRQADLKLTVESVSPTAVRMRLHGDYLLTSKPLPFEGMRKGTSVNDMPDNCYDARVEGQLVYDPAKKQFTRWDMIAVGDYTGFSQAIEWQGPNQQSKYFAYEPEVIATSFEVDRYNYEVAPEYRRTIPYMLWWFRDRKDKNYDYYYNPDKWEADWKKRHKQ